MSVLTWNGAGQKRFEAGVDRGVLFVSGQAGVAWNGLLSLAQSNSDATVVSYYNDGAKYLNKVTPGEFQATLAAYTYPEEFEVCDGTIELENGFMIGEQERQPFSLSYRTRLGNDLESVEFGYKLHFLYNATATPSASTYNSIGDGVTPQSFSWGLTTLPIQLPGYLPSSHFTLDSRRTPVAVMRAIESILYGSSTTNPKMPHPEDIRSLFVEVPAEVDSKNTFTAAFKARF